MFDAVLVPGGAHSAEALLRNGDAVHYVLEAYKHGKAICLIGEAAQWLPLLGLAAEAASGLGVVVGKNDPALRPQLTQDFVAAMARHRHWSRSVEAIGA